MSTHALFIFRSMPRGFFASIYTHFDGSPKGAAINLKRVLESPSHGNLATQFIRANPQAEIANDLHPGSNGEHYQYRVTEAENGDTTVRVHRIEPGSALEGRKMVEIFCGTLEEFLEKASSLDTN